MTELTLGLDLGPNSVGWALLDEGRQRLLATGVRVFPEGVDRDQQGGERSKSEQRRIARGMRRQIARRARRKRELRRELVEAGLLPPAALRDASDSERVAWEKAQFRKEDPYSLRRRAVKERLELHDIGRVLVHLNQRRGFLSNRKADRARKKETSDMLKEISALAAEMDDRTLGEYLAGLQDQDARARLRNRHTRRDMYEQEFDIIWSTQQAFHPGTLTEDLRAKIHRTIFFQRDMYWPASVVGHCELEPHLPRCQRADRRAQRFRLLQEVNNLRLLDPSTREERKLTDDERIRLIAMLATKKEASFDDIRKKLFPEQYEGVRFNLERGDRSKLQGMPCDYALAHKSLFGKAWHKRAEDQKDRIVAAVVDASESRLRYLLTEFGFDPALTEKLLEIDLGEGYSSYSLHAIKKLLPHLANGLPMTSRDDTPCALREAGYLMPWEHTPNQQPFLPQPPEITNPLVRQALHEVRKVVNAILRELVCRPGHKLARIHIELARDVKGTGEQRARQSKLMRQRQSQRDAAAEEIRAAGIKPSRDAIERYLLWQEQKKTCIYSGRTISFTQLLGGEVDVDHILPYSRSLDNSLGNRVVCFRDENAAKGDRTPVEWLAEQDPQKYEQILQRADSLPDFPKAARFRQRSVELDDFINRQLSDTTYITSKVAEYVRCLGAEVICTKGQLTAELRWQWGLGTVLRDDGLNLKNREDHRHHAVDAIVIALTNRSRLQQLARIRREGGTERTGEILPDPWPNFRASVEQTINAINVSHRVQRKVAGALHEETIYGPTAKPGEFVYRKPLGSLTPAMIDSIRDPAIRQLVVERLRAHGIEPGSNQKITADVWKEPLLMPSGIPIRKVRLLKKEGTIQPIRGGTAYVKPGSIHHLCIFEFTDDRGKTKREAVFVSMLEAIDRIKQGQPIIQRAHPERPDAKFIMSLSRGEAVLGTFKGQQQLMLVRTSVSTEKKIIFVHNTDARPDKTIAKLSVSASKLKGRKVTVDSLGRLRWAND